MRIIFKEYERKRSPYTKHKYRARPRTEPHRTVPTKNASIYAMQYIIILRKTMCIVQSTDDDDDVQGEVRAEL